MADDKETEIQKMKRLGTKEYIRQLNEAKSKIKQEKEFNKTGQYSFKLEPPGLKEGGLLGQYPVQVKKVPFKGVF